MLKNKWRIIALLVAVILVLMVPTVRAENEVTNQDASVMPISEDPEATTSEETTQEETTSEETTQEETTSESNFKRSDVFLTGENVTIDYVVDGNLFVLANSLTINSQIGGDVFAIANSINIGEEGYVFSNLFALSSDVTISGIVYDLYTSSNNVTINGYIYRDVRVISDSLNINGIVGRNAFVKTNSINFATGSTEENQITSNGIINGDLNYTANAELSIPEGAVTGTTNFTKSNNSNTVSVQEYILSLGKFLTTIAIIWLICLWLAPKFLNNASELVSKKSLPILGYGILAPILTLIAFVVLIILGITSNIALFALALLFLLFAISSSIFAIAFNQFICKKLKIEKTIGTLGMLILLSAILWGISLIPYIGVLVSLVISVYGLGLIVYCIIPKKDKKDTKTAVK